MGRDTESATIVKTLREVAEHFGVAEDIVSRDWKRTGMPGERGRYDLDAIGRWKRTRNRDPDATRERDTANPDLRSARERKMEAEARAKLADAERKERENRLASEQLIDRQDVQRFFAGFNEYIRDRLAEVPSKARAEFPDDSPAAPSAVVEIVAELIDSFLSGAKFWQRRFSRKFDGDSDASVA